MRLLWTPSERVVTLRTTMNRVLLVTLSLVAVATVGILFAYAQIKQTMNTRSLVSTLERDTPAQLEALIPSFLVPEQRSGAIVLLDRFKASGDLDEAKLLAPGEPLAGKFSSCKTSDEPLSCVEDGGLRIAYVVPIREGNQVFGHFVKVKRVSNPLADDAILHMIEAASGVLILVFLALFILSSRITAREIPDELSNLATWVESVLADRASTKAPKFRFKELNDLGEKIAEILERHEMARDQAVVGQLTSGIMHDLKTPIHPIVTAHGLAAEQPVGTPKRLQRLENLFRACSSNLPIIGNLIESTLDGSREIHVERQTTDLRNTIQQALALHSPAVRHRKVQINVTLGDSPVMISHDPWQMSRVFANVIKNSIDALDDARKQASDHPARLGIVLEQSADGSAMIRMEDSGFGLPADPEKVFRVFRSSKPRGCGLGLMISRKIVEAHGGQISAGRSERLAGAKFEVRLPPFSGETHAMEADV